MKKKNVEAILAGRPLPRPLHDPLLKARPFLLLAFAITLMLGVSFALDIKDNLTGIKVLAWMSTFGVGLIVQLIVLMVIPRKPADAIYLRSFGREEATFDARFLVECIFYPDIRVAGIRSPQRRLPLFIRPFLFGVFVFKYLGARYMNLEAGEDWYARLWRTLGGCRTVIIDLREMTDNVGAEISLCFEALGLERTLFIVDDDWSLEQVHAEIHKWSGRIPECEINIAKWQGDSDAAIDSFCAEVQQFKDKLPSKLIGLAWDALPRIKNAIMEGKEVLRSRIIDWSQLAIGFGIVIAMNLPVAKESLANIFKLAFENPFFGFLLNVLAGFFVALVLATIFSLFRSNPLARKSKRRYRVLLLKTQGANTVFLWGIAVVLAIFLSTANIFFKHQAKGAQIQLTKLRMHKLHRAFSLYKLDFGNYPLNKGGDWRHSLLQKRIISTDLDALDGWGNEITVKLLNGRKLVFRSGGPDGKMGTEDDVVISH